MTETESPNQQSLDAFQAESSDTADEQQSQSNPTQTENTSSSTSPLTEFYEVLTKASENRLPAAAQNLAVSNPIEPESRRHTTKDIPDGVPALPFEIGQWELAVSNSERVIYATSGDAYDYRWGEGGALCGMEVYLNNRGANKDGKYHRRVSTVVGFENGDQIKRKSIDSKDDLITVRGHSVGENDGDYGYGSGTKTRAETAEEAIVELILHLHHNPGPFGRYVETEPATDWSLHKLSPRSVTWTADGPAKTDDDTLRLSLHDNKLSIKSNDEDQPVHMTSYYYLPALESVSESLVVDRGKIHKFETPAAAITAANDLLSEPPAESVTAGQVE
jgi:hypothetical protein